jgi:hypothetical protein
MKLDYLKMLKDIDDLVETDFCFDMDGRSLPHSRPFTQEEGLKMAGLLGQIYSIAHCIDCPSCAVKYLVKKKV